MHTFEPPRRTHFATDDSEAAWEFLVEAYGVNRAPGGLREGASLVCEQLHAGPMVCARLTIPFEEVNFAMEGQGAYVFNTWRGGGSEQDWGPGQMRYGAGDSFVSVLPRGHCRGSFGHCEGTTIFMPAYMLQDAAAEASVNGSRTWEFETRLPSASGKAIWRHTETFLEGVLSDAEASSSPLVLGSVARMAAATALAVFPNTAHPDLAARDGRDSRPESLRRAIAFIDSSPDQDISLSDIAEAACVSPRALQIAFRRHLDTTPIAYLRRVRLHHAHRQLTEAQPGDGLSVARLAAEWGFANAGRFAASYRAEYGRLPNETLRGSS
jgi:AraC-like DNA-binding protein